MKSAFCGELPGGLLEKILHRIKIKERNIALRNTVVISAVFAFSCIGIFASFMKFLSDIKSSGFIEFFSLFFSDFPSIANYWHSFSMILLESFPAISLSLVLILAFVFFTSMLSLTKNIKTLIHFSH